MKIYRKGHNHSKDSHFTICIEIPAFNANNVDSDQTPHYAASDLCLHCLPVSLVCDARYKCV